ncbi:uncharacterized protein PRCAT00004950001 [Priceomyces carsonii]|uniref:uncharacterized protein n=1 Tax=Priceomyces carsonii TaxID=28549 RepID=UPI002ED932EE|nr:unnamed protein product [Priceomyces carsonii]
MSDLHKSFLKRIKEHEQAIGLGSISESHNDTTEEINNSSSNLDTLHKFKAKVFSKIETYDNGEITFQTYFRPPENEGAAIFVFHHGAGSSAMTFGKLAESLIEHSESGFLLFDARSHGSSSKADDYSLSSLTKDFKFIIDKFTATYNPKNTIYLIGHSLGGAVLTNYLVENPDQCHNVKGLIMLDIVEETAVKSLSAMPSFVQKRPRAFKSLQDGIDWHFHVSHLLNNYDSACISVPDLLWKSDNGSYEWITDLYATQSYWDTWFKGLSQNFIDCGKKQNIAKLLILSAHETLDKSLIIGQMQGKYQLVVFNNIAKAGHFLHEDIPKQIAQTLIDFVKRIDSPSEYMKKEFGVVPKWGGKIHS